MKKLYVSRYVPYSDRVRSQKLLMLKTSLISIAVIFGIISVSFLAADYAPNDLFLKVLKKDISSATVQAQQTTLTPYIYPEPESETRAKADRFREIKLEEYYSHTYIPGESELDNVYLYDSKRICYLTFDDGPSSVTPKILDVLNKYNVKATFFVTGQMAKRNPEILKSIYAGGHSIGNHSFSHDYNAVYASRESFKNEVLSCQNAINEALGFEYENLLFRFPGGFASLTDENTKSQYTSVLGETGYKYTDWSCLTGDSNVTAPTPQYLMDTLKYGVGNTKTGDVVVLMHDSASKEITADVLDDVLDYMLLLGFEFDVLRKQ